ncbi:DUF192 domain-containing protein [Mariniflexile litorale]|uniref:DUF192 domain-containing protein n=1 Tax=Mariniflexile litorale TaxID=3045158 RepID=A0AAU7EHE5_9FLAO|nr:DUF192 domain-containing protein [Mariniflexile sp. KMM 9835]MDQ8210043.1 DUF192 domain-containing protein [Mariniflexile sp. KMM 9835]
MFIKHITLISILTLSVFACKEDKKPIKQTDISFKKEGELSIFKLVDSTSLKIDIEIADTDFDIQTGLMYRDSMKKNQGMLFVFDDETERYFYMKNTKIALDLVYINGAKKIVSFQKNAKPFDETSLPSNEPAKYVLEVNAGLTDEWSLTVGDSISYSE